MHVSIAILLGSALGGLARFHLSSLVQRLSGPGFPWGTFAVNILGCALMGFAAAWMGHRSNWSHEARHFAMTGLLGGFTTFSAFGYETMRLVEEGAWSRAVLNAAGTLLLCLVGIWVGGTVARAFR